MSWDWQEIYVVVAIPVKHKTLYHYEPKERFIKQPPKNPKYHNAIYEGTLPECVTFIESKPDKLTIDEYAELV